MDGFWFADEAIQAPSVTNRFFTWWHWLWAFSTDVFGSRPIRAVPISWIVRPGGLSSTNDVTSLAPAASSISAAVTDKIGRATSELQSRLHLVCRLLLEKKKNRHISCTSWSCTHDDLCNH